MAWQFWDRLRAFFKSSQIYQSENILQDQPDLTRLLKSGDVLNFSRSNALLEQTNIQINRLERMKDFDQMSEVGEISLALDLFADEACIHGDTVIPLLDGTYPTIRELSNLNKPFWIYAYDVVNEKYVPAKAHSARVTGRNVKIVEVILDDGASIKCTEDHLFLTKDNQYIRAKDLQFGQSLKPLYKKFCKNKKRKNHYEALFLDGSFIMTHRWVAKSIGINGKVIHHKDFNGINNTPENLQGMSHEEHLEIHGNFKGDKNGSFKDISKTELLKAMNNLDSPHKKDLMWKLDCGERVLRRLLKQYKINWKDFISEKFGTCHCGNIKRPLKNECSDCSKITKRLNSSRHFVNNKELIYIKKSKRRRVKNFKCKWCKNIFPAKMRSTPFSPYCDECREKAKRHTKRRNNRNYERRSKLLNHKVVSVRDCGIADEVYDIEVPNYHNFAAGTKDSWVIIHNSLIDPEKRHVFWIRSKNKAVKEELEELFFNTMLMDAQLRPMIRYLCKAGDFAAEIIPTVNRDGVAGMKFFDIYNFTRVETRKGDLVGFYYQDEFEQEPIFFHPWQVMHVRLTTFENLYMPYGQCLKSDTPVLTPSGYKEIKDLKPGDEVYSYDHQKPIITKVVAQKITGHKKIYNIRTRHYDVQCSANHPILVFRDGIEQYVRADDISIGDKLVILKPNHQNEVQYITKPYVRARLKESGRELVKNNKLGYEKASKLSGVSKGISRQFLIDGKSADIESAVKLMSLFDINESDTEPALYGTQKDVNTPEEVDDDFARFYGFMLGDGWITKNTVEIALGMDEVQNSLYIEYLEKYSNAKVTFKYDSNGRAIAAMIGCKMLADILRNLGFDGKAWQKRIPEWAFRSSRNIKVNLIQGMLDADGCEYLDHGKYVRFYYCSTSMELIRGLKLLLHQLDMKCGHIDTRSHKKFDSDELTRPIYQLCFWNSELQFENNVLHENVTSIIEEPEAETADIQIDHPCSNFIANGIVVHNSILDPARKIYKQLRLMEDAAIVYRLTRAPERRVFKIPVGHIPTKDVPQFMQAIGRQFKKKQIFDPASGNVTERWNPLIQEDDYWLPVRPDGSGPTVDTLPGAENLDQIADIEYFKKKMVAALKVPYARVGMGEQGEDSKQSLSQVAPEFAKSVQWIQRQAQMGLKKIACVHLALKGFSEDDIKNFDIVMTASSAIDELYRMEVWKGRADVIDQIKGTELFTDKYILSNFTDLSEDEIEMLEKEKQEQREKEKEEEEGKEVLEHKDIDEALIEAKELFEEEKLSLEAVNIVPFYRRNRSAIHNSSSYMYNHGEFDGLPNPNQDEDSKVLVESIVSDNDKTEAIAEAYKVIIEENRSFDSDENDSEEEQEITDNDIPA